MQVELSPKQEQIVNNILEWYKSPKQTITLGGYAGTGKTTIIAQLTSRLISNHKDIKIHYASFTGKAVQVLKSKLKSAELKIQDSQITTIHRLLYTPELNKDGQIVGWKKIVKDNMQINLIIIDEASMVNKQIWQDITSLGCKVLAVGDHGQLPPIGDAFNLMQNPELKLEEIFRQEAQSSIIQASILAREKGEIPFGNLGDDVKKMSRSDPDTQEFLGELFSKFSDSMLVLTGYNHTRIKLNKAIRKILELESELPQVSDRVICLRNNHTKKIYNGMIGTVIDSKQLEQPNADLLELQINFDGEDTIYTGDSLINQFNNIESFKDEKRKDVDLFDFGYAITVHKAQGSQADTVVLFEERFAKTSQEDWHRWLYTAVTRAAKKLYIIG